MATLFKICQAEDDEACHKEARALCYHCSRDLCIDHLTQHAQLMDELTRSCLNDYLKILGKASIHLQSLTIPRQISSEPFLKLEQWRKDAYRQIDDIVSRRIQEIQNYVEDYQLIFDRMRKEQIEKISRYKQKVIDSLRKAQMANKELSQLRTNIEQIQNDLNLFEKHSIDIISNRPSTHSISIRMRCNEWKSINSSISTSSSSSSLPSLASIIRQFEFRLKFVRLNGIATSHSVLVEINGTVGDLIDEFIHKYNKNIPMNLSRNFYLPIEVSQHRMRQRFKNDLSLKKLFNRIESLILYESPFEINENNIEKSSLIFCQFNSGLPWEMKFDLPILITVPRVQCRGKHIIQSLEEKLLIDLNKINDANQFNYEVQLVDDKEPLSISIILNEWADQIIEEKFLIKDNATLVVNIVHRNSSSINSKLKRKNSVDRISFPNNDHRFKN